MGDRHTVFARAELAVIPAHHLHAHEYRAELHGRQTGSWLRAAVRGRQGAGAWHRRHRGAQPASHGARPPLLGERGAELLGLLRLAADPPRDVTRDRLDARRDRGVSLCSRDWCSSSLLPCWPPHSASTPVAPTPPVQASPPSPAGPPTVTLSASGFAPREITVPVGGRVTFVNADRVGHDINSGLDHTSRECAEVDVVGFLVAGQSRDRHIRGDEAVSIPRSRQRRKSGVSRAHRGAVTGIRGRGQGLGTAGPECV